MYAGAFSVVMKANYRKQQKGRGIPVAVKIFTNDSIINASNFHHLCEEAEKEAEIMLKAKNELQQVEYIVNVLGVANGPLTEALSAAFPKAVKAGESAFGVVMEYLGGGSLEKLVTPDYSNNTNDKHKEESWILPMVDKIRLLKEIATGLTDLHSVGIVHGDIKPQNVMLTDKKTAKLADFGLASVTNTTKEFGASTLQKTNKTRGTPIYIAPEMIDQGTGSVARSSRSTDVYAFAILMYFVLAEKVPFDGTSTYGLYSQVIEGVRPALEDLPKNTPPSVTRLMEACWSADRKERKSATECCAILSHVYNLLNSSKFDIFFSHAWKDKAFLSYVYRVLSEHGYKIWYDQMEMGYDLKKSMEEGVANSSILLACLGSAYEESQNCMFELKEGKKQGKTIVGLFINCGYDKIASSEVQDAVEFGDNHKQGKLYHDISKIATNAEWSSESGPSIQLTRQTKEALNPLLKILQDAAKCAPTLLGETKHDDRSIDNDDGASASSSSASASTVTASATSVKKPINHEVKINYNEAEMAKEDRELLKDFAEVILLYI